MPTPSLMGRHDDAAGRQTFDQSFQCLDGYHRMVDEKKKSSGCVPRKNADARLKRSDHALLVILIEDQLDAVDGLLNFVTMMPDHNNRVFDRRAGNRIDDVLQKRVPAERKERFMRSHPFG